MLTIVLPSIDDESSVKLKLEHSLVSLSKWEAEHEKAFFGHEEKTADELVSYMKHMVIGDDPPVNFIDRLVPEQFQEIAEYMNSKQTATFFREDKNARKSREVITSELIYYWLVQFSIPFCPTEYWHVNRIMTLVKIAGIKQSKPKKMTRQEVAQQQRELNAQRREQLGTSG